MMLVVRNSSSNLNNINALIISYINLCIRLVPGVVVGYFREAIIVLRTFLIDLIR